MGPERLKVMERWNLAFAGIAIIVAALAFDAPVVWGVLVGSALACVNFWAIRKIWESLLHTPAEATARRQSIQTLFIFKTIALVAVVFVAIRFLPISPVAFAVGISIFLLSIAVESARYALRGPASSER